ncbi:MAG: hypothetical protein ACKVU4_15020 [Phycisphaerales bacterium]
MDRSAAVSGVDFPDDATVARMRALTPAQRMYMLDRLVESGRAWMAAGIRSEHPEWTPQQVAREVARRVRDAAQ